MRGRPGAARPRACRSEPSRWTAPLTPRRRSVPGQRQPPRRDRPGPPRPRRSPPPPGAGAPPGGWAGGPRPAPGRRSHRARQPSGGPRPASARHPDRRVAVRHGVQPPAHVPLEPSRPADVVVDRAGHARTWREASPGDGGGTLASVAGRAAVGAALARREGLPLAVRARPGAAVDARAAAHRPASASRVGLAVGRDRAHGGTSWGRSSDARHPSCRPGDRRVAVRARLRPPSACRVSGPAGPGSRRSPRPAPPRP